MPFNDKWNIDETEFLVYSKGQEILFLLSLKKLSVWLVFKAYSLCM